MKTDATPQPSDYVDQVTTFVQQAQVFTEEFSTLVQTVHKFGATCTELVHSTIRESIHDDIELKHCLQEFTTLLISVQTHSQTLLDLVQKLLQFGNLNHTEIQSKKDSFRRGVYGPVTNYTEQLKKYLQLSRKTYKELKKAFVTVKKHHKKASMDCALKQVENKRIASRTVGGVASIATSGVALSIVAGIFTLGIGTAVGLSLTAGVTAAAGVAAGGAAIGTTVGVVGFLSASHFKKLQDVFQEMSSNFDALNKQLRVMGSSIEKLEEVLNIISCDVSNVEGNVTKRVELEQFYTVFDILLGGIRMAHRINNDLLHLNKCN